MTYEYNATVLRVIDGDTYELDIDLGFYTHLVHKIRLKGIDCPEHDTPEGQLAKSFVEKWFSAHGNPCIIQTDKVVEQSYDRYVATVMVFDKEQGTNVELAHILRGQGFFKSVERLGPKNERTE